MQEIVVADIGGTHARFAIAEIDAGRVVSLDHQVKMRGADHASLQIAWEAYAAQIGRELPREAALAVAGPVGGDVLYFTNSSWMIRPALVPEKLKLDRFSLINDFGAVGHAVVHMDSEQFSHICGPETALTEDGPITVLGPGTGLGVVNVLRKGGDYFVTETEGGHIDFAPHDEFEDALLKKLREQHRRVSAERVASGPGIRVIYNLLAEVEGQSAKDLDDRALWTLAFSGEDSLAAAAFDRFCLCLGSVAGNLALAHGSRQVIMAGGLGQRIGSALLTSGFRERFVAKGRFQSMMEQISVKQLIHEEPGLYGAAAAFIKEYGI
ncbi:glucokinase [Parasphingorhabdus halotolerans]|uniref:Glucokinase n=1 Tax=Parasphingorhabdus halotolerans TaxID=2725558 RepID=A0A6H2DS39_9SPHN|nr:glucokinase [Parasphingorhabdus halotolerans]QJB70476.1 glucokinase [Parasphingorhabdus halotolerans]